MRPCAADPCKKITGTPDVRSCVLLWNTPYWNNDLMYKGSQTIWLCFIKHWSHSSGFPESNLSRLRWHRSRILRAELSYDRVGTRGQHPMEPHFILYWNGHLFLFNVKVLTCDTNALRLQNRGVSVAKWWIFGGSKFLDIPIFILQSMARSTQIILPGPSWRILQHFKSVSLF